MQRAVLAPRRLGAAALAGGARRHRGGHGRHWYKKFREDPDSFVKHTVLEPFDFDKPTLNGARRSKVYFELESDGTHEGRVEFELLDDYLPRTCENFKLLAAGKSLSGFSYLGSPFAMKLLKDVCFLGGGVPVPGPRDREVMTSHSAFKNRFFGDEGFFAPHAVPGLLSMASTGLGTNGSTFYVDMRPNYHLDGRCVVFGRVAQGWDVVQRLNDTLYTQRQVPVKKVVIADCGVLGPLYSSV